MKILYGDIFYMIVFIWIMIWMYTEWLNVRLQIVLHPSLDIIQIRTWPLFQLWVVELSLACSMHMPPMKPKQNGHSGSLVQVPHQHNSLQPAAFSPLPSPWTSISRYLEWWNWNWRTHNKKTSNTFGSIFSWKINDIT